MNDEDKTAKSLLEMATGAFLMPWPKKPLPAAKGAKGGKGAAKTGKVSQGMPKSMTRSKAHTSRGSFNKKQNAGGNWF